MDDIDWIRLFTKLAQELRDYDHDGPALGLNMNPRDVDALDRSCARLYMQDHRPESVYGMRLVPNPLVDPGVALAVADGEVIGRLTLGGELVVRGSTRAQERRSKRGGG